MKHLTLLAALAATAALIASPALAEQHEGGDQKGHKGKMFERLDTNKDGFVTKLEFVAESEARFTKMDSNGDGKVSQEEAKSHHEAMRAKHKEKREDRKEKRDDKAAE